MAFRDITLFAPRPGSKNKNLNPGISSKLLQLAALEPSMLLEQFQSRPDGLTQEEAETRLEQYGKNIFIKEQRLSFFQRLWENLRNPLVILLAVLDGLSFLTGDPHVQKGIVE